MYSYRTCTCRIAVNDKTVYSLLHEPHRDKTNKMARAPSKTSDQPGHPPSLIRVFAIRLKKARILSYPLIAQQRLWSDWADAQADLSLRWAHTPFCWFCHDAAHMTENWTWRPDMGSSQGRGIRKQYLHTGYAEATNTIGNNSRGYNNDVTGIPTVRKRLILALFWYYLECYFAHCQFM